MGGLNVPSWILRLLEFGRKAEVVTAVIVIAAVVALILPIPFWLLDVLIALNICTASLLIIVVLQIKDSVSLSTFPTILLMTTLFRVALTVASTRLILLEGSAGHIIEAFGEVVVGGNLVVGLVVFTILTLIQFLVITKGSERVAEVGARFTLDAMPGKQLAIDIDLKSGAITPDDAKRRRVQIGLESQFFGAMDGALKFVKGDAIAGIVIALTNLLGGFAIGITQRNMTAIESMHLYSVLSIGDALVAQIPALMLSLTAGLLITRVATTEGVGRDVGKEIAFQLLSQPKAWIMASGAMLVFGLVPGMPTFVFVLIGASALFMGIKTLKDRTQIISADPSAIVSSIEPVHEFKILRHFLIRISSQVENKAKAVKTVDLANQIRNDLVKLYGIVPPNIEIEFGASIADADFEFCYNEVRVFALKLNENLCSVVCDSEKLNELQIPIERIETDARHVKHKRHWVASSYCDQLQQNKLEYETYWDYLSRRFEFEFMRLAPNHFGIDKVTKICRWVSEFNPELSKELERVLSVARVVDVFQRLLRERISIRNLPVIFETLVEWGQKERDPAMLCECVRYALSREICSNYATDTTLNAIMLDIELEELIFGAVRQTNYGDYLALPTELTDELSDQLSSMLEPVSSKLKPVIMCRQDVRPHVRRLWADRFNELPVISVNEVSPEYKISVLGVIGQNVRARLEAFHE